MRPGRVRWWGAAGLALLAAGTALVELRAAPWDRLFYLFAWYGWLLVVDALLSRAGRPSFVADRPRELAAMMLWSVPFWYLFEAYNLVLENWYYVSAFRERPVQLVVSWAAFATVLPACFFHAELVRGVLRLDRWRMPAQRIGPAVEAALVAFGAVSVVAPLLWPRWAFPLVWGATLWIPAVINRRRGGPSLLRDLERGRPGRTVALALGGLLAGLVWEALNWRAPMRWIYTVPGFEEPKLFEMPLPGFIGFPVLALAAFEAYGLVESLLRGGRHWEEPTEAPVPARSAPAPLYALVVLLAWAATLPVFHAVQRQTVRSYRPLLVELQGVDEALAERLRAEGIDAPERLAELTQEAADWRSLGRRLRVRPRELYEAAHQAELALHKGMGAPAAALLMEAGIDSVEALAAADAEALHDRLERLARARGREAPAPAEVRVWVRSARER